MKAASSCELETKAFGYQTVCKIKEDSTALEPSLLQQQSLYHWQSSAEAERRRRKARKLSRNLLKIDLLGISGRRDQSYFFYGLERKQGGDIITTFFFLSSSVVVVECKGTEAVVDILFEKKRNLWWWEQLWRLSLGGGSGKRVSQQLLLPCFFGCWYCFQLLRGIKPKGSSRGGVDVVG